MVNYLHLAYTVGFMDALLLVWKEIKISCKHKKQYEIKAIYCKIITTDLNNNKNASP